MLPLVGPENPGNRAIGRVGGGRSEPAQRGKGRQMADFVKAFAEDQKAAEVLKMQHEVNQNERMFSLLAQALGPTGSWTAKEEEKGFAVTWSRCWWLGAERRGHGEDCPKWAMHCHSPPYVGWTFSTTSNDP